MCLNVLICLVQTYNQTRQTYKTRLSAKTARQRRQIERQDKAGRQTEITASRTDKTARQTDRQSTRQCTEDKQTGQADIQHQQHALFAQ